MRREAVSVTGKVVLLASLLGCVVHLAMSQVDYLPLSQVKPGMVGIGKTAVRGNLIEEFNITVVGVIDNPGDGNDWILVRAGGRAIELSGGVAAGMSGSPVYVDGKLIGAVRAAWYWAASPNPIIYLTPIEKMLEMLKYPVTLSALPTEADVPTDGVRSGGTEVVDAVGGTGALARGDMGLDMPHGYWVYLEGTPVAGGFSPVTMTYLERGLPSSKVDEVRAALLPDLGRPSLLDQFFQTLTRGLGNVVDGQSLAGILQSGSGSTAEEETFLPGSAMGALLAVGDYYYGWFGTTTFRTVVNLSGKASEIVVGMAHPLLHLGATGYFLNPVKVIDTVQCLDRSRKLGVPSGLPGAPVVSGAITQDRDAGLVGVLGGAPQAIKLRVTVVNEDRGVERSSETRIALVHPSSSYPALLAWYAIYDTVLGALDRASPGVMWLDYTIKGRALPRPVRRQDVRVSETDIALATIQVAQVLYLLYANEIKDPQITEVDVRIRVTSSLQSLVIIEEVRTEELQYWTGDFVRYTVKLRTYRGEETVVRGTLSLPPTFSGGHVTVVAEPSYWGRTLWPYLGGWTRRTYPEEKEGMPLVRTLDDLVRVVETFAKGDSILVRLDGLDCPYIDCFNADELDRISDVVLLSALGLRGPVFGDAVYKIRVKSR